MPIIGAEVLKTQIYRVSVLLCQGIVENVVVTPDGLYSIVYIKNGKLENQTGKIINVVQNKGCPKNSYILFDSSSDMSSKRERIMFYQIQTLKDVTPNDAYMIALKHGFEGTVEDWLESLKGAPGASAYELAVLAGFEGTLEEWLVTLKGEKGDTGKSAYDMAVDRGYEGTEDQWLEAYGDTTQISNKVTIIENSLSWIEGMERPSAK